MNVIAKAASEIANHVIELDWAALRESALDSALALAKAEAGEFTEYAKGKVKEGWAKVDWLGTRNKYKNNLLDTLSTTKILGHPKAISIETIYTDCFVFDRIAAITRFAGDIESLQRDAFEVVTTRTRHPALDISRTGKNLFILGRPGAGKTTFLKYLAMLACRGNIAKTPIFVSIKDWSDSGKAIEPYIASQFDLCGFPKAEAFVTALLVKGEAIVLLDGLDEVSDDGNKRSQTIKEVVALSTKYRKCQYCLTCRIAATDYSFERFDYLEVADFTESQQLHFLKQWYGADSNQLKRFLQGWQDTNNAGIRELGKTPLLLTLLCLAFDETFQFPNRQVDLYREAIDALVRKWDASRLIGRDTFYKNLSFSRREHLLEHIAAHFYFNSKTVFAKRDVEKSVVEFLKGLPDKEKCEEADAGLVLRQIEAQHGLIVERAKNVYSFSHLTLQEYFTASFLVKAHDDKLLDQVVSVALKDQKWREVVLYTVALLPSADPILKRMSKQLVAMRGSEQGVMRFLAFCFCEASQRRRQLIGGYTFGEVRDIIKTKADLSTNLPLSTSEISKIAEHLVSIRAFLATREGRYDFGIAAGIFAVAADIVAHTPSQVAKILGGHRARPDEFIAYLYACRLMVECLEVAVSNQRDGHLQSVMTLDEQSILRAADLG